MATTIQVKDDTMRLLDALKEASKAKSYDETLKMLLAEKFRLPTQMFGVDRGKISRFKEEDRAEDRDVSLR